MISIHPEQVLADDLNSGCELELDFFSLTLSHSHTSILSHLIYTFSYFKIALLVQLLFIY